MCAVCAREGVPFPLPLHSQSAAAAASAVPTSSTIQAMKKWSSLNAFSDSSSGTSFPSRYLEQKKVVE